MHPYFKKLIDYPKAFDIYIDCGTEGTRQFILQRSDRDGWFLSDGMLHIYIEDEDVTVHDHMESDDGSYIVFEIDEVIHKLEVREPGVVIKGFFSN